MATKKTNPVLKQLLWLAILLCVWLSGGVGGALLAGGAYERRYAGRIYPGVGVYGVDVGGLTVEEATVILQTDLPDPATLPLTLRDGVRVWSRSWADVGLRFDAAATARVAFQAGREGTPVEQRLFQLRALIGGQAVAPVVVLPDSAQIAAALAKLAPDVFLPPVDATLDIQSIGAAEWRVTPVRGQPGRELDVEATLSRLPWLFGVAREGIVMELIARPVEPAIADAGPAQAQAMALLARPFTLSADDPLTDFRATWDVEPGVVAAWLTVRVDGGTETVESRAADAPASSRLLLTIREEAVRAYLEAMGQKLNEEVGINIEGTVAAVRAAVEAGEGQAAVALLHYPRLYTVQPGDTLVSVAHAHGFPVWRLSEANPGVEPGRLRPGQQLTIPSIDVLFPLPLVRGRRIVVDLSEQHLYAYEEDTLVYSFVASTGIDSSPTIPGRFQILSKQEEAYASSWDLWMPHFMGIYRAGPDFTNGIHGLPTLSNGRRLWEGVLGRPVSYGCIVLGLQEAAALYNWAELGTLVVIQE